MGVDEQPPPVVLDRTTYTLRFEDPPLAGVVVRARKPTAGGHVDLVMAHAVVQASGGVAQMAVAAAAGDVAAADALYRVFRAFAGALLSWNLEDRDEPVPTTLDGVLSLDLEHAVELTNAWLEHIGTVDQQQRDTEAELQLPVEALG